MKKLLIIKSVLLAIVLNLTITNTMSAASYTVPIVATRAAVSKTGGITISGYMDCSEQVADYDWSEFGGSIGEPPANLTVLVNVNWDAYQPAGRKTVISARYGSDHKDPCYNSNPAIASICGTGFVEPCSWLTSHFNTSSTPFFVYSRDGKFAPGKVHVDVYGDSENWDGWIVINGELQCEYNGTRVDCMENDASPMTIGLFEFSGFDLRAAYTK